MKIARFLVFIFVAGFLTSSLTSCSSYLYYPSRAKFVDPLKIHPPPEEVVFFENPPSDEKLLAWSFKSPQKSKAVFVVFHGNAQNLSSHFMSMYWVLEKGYDLFIFDYPGYGGSHGAPTPQNTLDAGTRAIEYVQKRWPNLPIIVVGQSLGGSIALRSVADLKERKNICAVVAESTFDSYKKAGQSALSKFWLTWLLQPLAHVFLSDEFAAKGHIAQISPLPLLVIHRKDDPVVSSDLGLRVFAEAKEPKELWLLEGEGHVSTFTDVDRVENQKKLMEFIKPCIK